MQSVNDSTISFVSIQIQPISIEDLKKALADSGIELIISPKFPLIYFDEDTKQYESDPFAVLIDTSPAAETFQSPKVPATIPKN